MVSSWVEPMVEVGRASGVSVELVVEVELGTAIVMPTLSQRVAVKARVSSLLSEKVTQNEAGTYSGNLLDCTGS